MKKLIQIAINELTVRKINFYIQEKIGYKTDHYYFLLILISK